MEAYPIEVQPHWSRRIGAKSLAVSASGDYLFLEETDLLALREGRVSELPLGLQAKLKARQFTKAVTALGSESLLLSRQAARHGTLHEGPSLHIVVPTLQCAHSCQYCQVSRSLLDTGHTITKEDLLSVCESIFQSNARALTVEFQGGDPLLRFDLVKAAIIRIKELNRVHQRSIRFVIASTLHQLDKEICAFLREHHVLLSTSIDGPSSLHNRNRPVPGRDAYERTVRGIGLAREYLGFDAVSALMTTTKASLSFPEAIVDEYVNLGFEDIFLRPLSTYGFAKRNQALLGYEVIEFQQFYAKAFSRIIYWNKRGVPLREVYASIILNKILSPFDTGYVDLQSPTGAGQSVLVYNYDGYVYPSDEARMLAETGDVSLRLGKIGTPMSVLQKSVVQQALISSSLVAEMPDCHACAYQNFCAPNPIDAQAQFGRMDAPPASTEHCQRHIWLFDFFFQRIQQADPEMLDLFHAWAQPVKEARRLCDV
ncbi:His-Xaa-Ser system radical SAM maturase HxsB [Orrella dioscoreae]|uniref:His-Xaa-Ser system radical SAM maturase HxsB n=1 Tax=Orrella dioscoreae TaxID=1851544 RepID=A0A1C3JZW1_9BURK|nr:His-Xaa-Ser system radical SAM maturase HxsB [Orrella dioscoreae]SBT24695.1 His-Xaa-Ser system radical SAM maturase HxsB [Orrella dioscoreae]SOE50408.1 His-Xaa-Ser system radical SAM maturase HxsB [Orrella dioscoreae]